MADSVLGPTRSRTAAVAFVALVALLWIAVPASAESDCQRSDGWGFVVADWLDIDPPEGQYAGGPITITGNGTGIDNVVFYFGGDILGALGPINGDYSFSATVPDLPSGDYTVMTGRTEGGIYTQCRNVYTVLAPIAIIGDPSTDATVPLDTIDTTAPTTTTSTTTTSTTTTVPPPPPPAPTTTTTTTPPPPTPTTAVPASTAPTTTVGPGSSGPTAVAPTTTAVAVEISTTLAEPASTVSDTTLVAAAPQSDDGGASSDQMLFGLLIGLGAAVLLVLAWALGRRGRTTPGSYQPPPPPPPN